MSVQNSQVIRKQLVTAAYQQL